MTSPSGTVGKFKPNNGLAPLPPGGLIRNQTNAVPSQLASLSIVSKRERTTQAEDSNRIDGYGFLDRNYPNYNTPNPNIPNPNIPNPNIPNPNIPNPNIPNPNYDTSRGDNYKPLRRLPTTGGQCSYNQFHCRSDGTCIMNRYICDGRSDCRDGSDEEGCVDHEHDTELRKFPSSSITQRPNYGQSINGQYPSGQNFRPRDRRPPIDPRSQEEARIHHMEQQRLLHQRILEQNSRSSGQRFPPNPPKEGVDLQVYDTPQTQFVGYDVVFRCRDEGSARSSVKWYRKDGKPLPTTSTDIDGRLTMYGVTEDDAGVYVCSTTSRNFPIEEKEATLTVSPRSLLENLRSYSFCSTEFQRRRKRK